MRLSFPPGDLHLESSGREFRVILRGEVLLTTQSEKKAVAKYTALRKALEDEHPMPPLTNEERAALLGKQIGEQRVDDNHYRPQQTKPKRKHSSRTFG